MFWKSWYLSCFLAVPGHLEYPQIYSTKMKGWVPFLLPNIPNELLFCSTFLEFSLSISLPIKIISFFLWADPFDVQSFYVWITACPFEYTIFSSKTVVSGLVEMGGSAVQSACCSCKGLAFNSQNAHGGSQPPVALIPGESSFELSWLH